MAQSQAEQQAQAQIAGEPTRTKERQPRPATGTAADPTAQAQQNDEQGGLERKMETRHLTMISLGGVIGTGLFLSSGYTIHQAGEEILKWIYCNTPSFNMPSSAVCWQALFADLSVRIS